MQFFRLDNWEDDSRRRRRFVPNPHGSTHASANISPLQLGAKKPLGVESAVLKASTIHEETGGGCLPTADGSGELTSLSGSEEIPEQSNAAADEGELSRKRTDDQDLISLCTERDRKLVALNSTLEFISASMLNRLYGAELCSICHHFVGDL